MCAITKFHVFSMLSNSGRGPTQRGGCLALAVIESSDKHTCKKKKRFQKHEILT